MQLKKWDKKKCQIYAIHAYNLEDKKNLVMEGYLVLWEFQDVFLEELPGMTPNKDIEFAINLAPRLTLILRELYKMSAHELV